jgi:hypothetical protein
MQLSDCCLSKLIFFQNAPKYRRLRGLEHQLLRSPRQISTPHGHRQRELGDGRSPFRQQGNSTVLQQEKNISFHQHLVS